MQCELFYMKMGWDVTTAELVMPLLQDTAWCLNDSMNDCDSRTELCSAVGDTSQGVQQQASVRTSLSSTLHALQLV